MEKWISLFIAYGLGSLPTGFLLARALKGIDLREHGSKSIGATNVFRVVGKKWGIAVLLVDAFKGWLGVALPYFIFQSHLSGTWSLALAIAALLGNTFPVWLKFKGGKGIATSLGVFLGLVPMPALATFGLWCLVFAATRILSAASLSAAFFFPAMIYLFLRGHDSFHAFFALSLCLPVFIVYTHRANIRRLLKGEEKRLL